MNYYDPYSYDTRGRQSEAERRAEREQAYNERWRLGPYATESAPGPASAHHAAGVLPAPPRRSA